jgi:valyl-tRNA synthetase
LEANGEVDDFLPYLMALARLQKVEKVAALPARQAPIGVLGEMRFMLVVEINEKDEFERVQSALQKIDQEVERVSAKLANESFLTRAPKAIIQKEREKKETLLQEREALMAQLQHLASSAAKK